MPEGRGAFFSVERQTWEAAIALGINAGIAFLIVARGTAADNRTSVWSVHAIENHTGISRPKAESAIAALIGGGVLRRLEPDEIARRVEAGVLSRHPRRGTPVFEIRLAETGEPPIWLPNSLVDGLDRSPVPPLERVRQTQNPAALRLLVALYAEHDLQFSGGVPFRAVRQTYDRERVTESRGYVVWSFEQASSEAFLHRRPAAALVTERDTKAGWQVFSAALNALIGLGLVKFVAHLVDSDTDDGEIIMPVDQHNGQAAEMQVATAAHWAAVRLLGPNGEAIAERKGWALLVPVRPHAEAVQVVGVLRLLHRPANFATAAWLARSSEWDGLAASFDQIAAEVDTGPWRARA